MNKRSISTAFAALAITALSATAVLAAPPGGATNHGSSVSAVARAATAVSGKSHGEIVSALAKTHGAQVSAAARAKGEAAAAAGKAKGAAASEPGRIKATEHTPQP